MIGAIVVLIGLIALGGLVFVYMHWLDEAKKNGVTKHDYYIENTDDTEDEEDE